MRVQVEDRRRQHLLAAEGEQLARQRRRALGGIGDLFAWPAQRSRRRIQLRASNSL